MSKRVYVVQSAMKREQENTFERFSIYGVFTTMKRAKQAINSGYEINKGDNISEYNNCDQMQVNYDLLSTDGIKCNYRAIIEEQAINRDWYK